MPWRLPLVIVAVMLFVVSTVLWSYDRQKTFEAKMQAVCGNDVVVSIEKYGALPTSKCHRIVCGNIAIKTQYDRIKCE